MNYICPNCGNLVESEKKDESIFCNDCGSTFTPYDGKKYLEKRYAKLSNKAYKESYYKLNFEKAIELYEEALLLKPNDFSSLTGLMMASIFNHNYEDLKFNLPKTYFEEYDIELNSANSLIYLNFISDYIHQVNVFYRNANLTLFTDKDFKNEEYKTYFLNGLKDITTNLTYLKENLSLVEEEEYNHYLEQNPEFLTKIDETLTKNQELLKGANKLKALNEEVTPNLRVIIINNKFKLYNYLLFAGIIIFLLAAIILLVIGTNLDNEIITILSIAPVVLGLIFLLVMRIVMKKLT